MMTSMSTFELLYLITPIVGIVIVGALMAYIAYRDKQRGI